MEIERKFLVKEKQQVVGQEYTKIEQVYLSFDPEIRVRKSRYPDGSYSYHLTMKAGAGLVREEVDKEISSGQYERLTDGNRFRVHKQRYKIPLDGGLTAELDLYSGHLQGVELVEVEFGSVEEAKAFVPPSWFGQEVTDDLGFKGKNLARRSVSPAEATADVMLCPRCGELALFYSTQESFVCENETCGWRSPKHPRRFEAVSFDQWLKSIAIPHGEEPLKVGCRRIAQTGDGQWWAYLVVSGSEKAIPVKVPRHVEIGRVTREALWF